MYSFSQIRRGLSRPQYVARELNRLYHRRLYTRPFNTQGVSIFEEDWDILVILDACRYDMFKEQSDLEGTLEFRRSRGSNTVEFLSANFAAKDLSDTVYVTANPQLYRHRDRINPNLHAVIDVWQEDGWDEEHKTVLPETMVEYTERIAREYPNKRIVSHFIQPHYPFLVDEIVFDDSEVFLQPDEPDCWNQIFTGDIRVKKSSVWQAYRATLDRALPSVASLTKSLKGKTVITSDHGNMVGERSFPVPIKDWGHPHGLYTKQLVKVPWLIIEDSDRRTVNAEPRSKSQRDIDGSIVEKRLEQLGYR